MSLPSFFKAQFLKAAVSTVAKSNDHKATVLGALGAAVLASKIDYGKLLQGDPQELGNVAGCLLTAALGFYMNKPSKAA